ncbi:MAG: hypothetical protein KDE46_31650, partial [Caldilineaceae bacterium]|nr:hypothetical protein [Caldilineaceae bacterium]
MNTTIPNPSGAKTFAQLSEVERQQIEAFMSANQRRRRMNLVLMYIFLVVIAFAVFGLVTGAFNYYWVR